MLPQTHISSKDGLASFVLASPEYELAPVGIGSFREQADRLAEFGRNGDVYVVHAAEGETVIPMEVLEANPQVRELLFNQMRDMGLDPNEYVVGSNLNSINPYTGMPEFFFKSIFKAIKKVIKVAAPMIIPMVVGTFAGPWGAMLASAALTKLQGGSWGDVLKGAALSYAGGALMKGIGASLSGTSLGPSLGYTSAAAAAGGPTTFMEGLWGGLKAPFSASAFQKLNPSGWASRGREALGQLGAAGKVATDYVTGPGEAAAAPGAPGDYYFDPVSAGPPAGFKPGDLGDLTKEVTFDVGTGIPPMTPTVPLGGPGDYVDPVFAGPPAGFKPGDLGDLTKEVTSTTAQAPPGKIQQLSPWAKDTVTTPSGKVLYGDDAREFVRTAYSTSLPEGVQPSEAGWQKYAEKNLGPGTIQKYGPSLALAGGAAYGLGAFDPPKRDPEMSDEEWEAFLKERLRNPIYYPAQEEDESDEDYEKRKELAQAPYRVASLDPNKYRLPPVLPPAGYRAAPFASGFRQTPLQGLFNRGRTLFAAHGGAVQYPPREMLVEGSGTERSDDIPAMLSDGEFVLNARSVRGADPTGQGDRYRGARNLYEMMRNFEMRA